MKNEVNDLPGIKHNLFDTVNDNREIADNFISSILFSSAIH